MEDSNPDHEVFLSYRRATSWPVTRLVFDELRSRGFDVFMDVRSIDGGSFPAQIESEIVRRRHFVLVLAEGSLGRISEPGDWLCREIELAFLYGRNIVPLFIDRFSHSDLALLPDAIRSLADLNGLTVGNAYFREAIDRLCNKFLVSAPKEQVSNAPRPAVAASPYVGRTPREPPPVGALFDLVDGSIVEDVSHRHVGESSAESPCFRMIGQVDALTGDKIWIAARASLGSLHSGLRRHRLLNLWTGSVDHDRKCGMFGTRCGFTPEGRYHWEARGRSVTLLGLTPGGREIHLTTPATSRSSMFHGRPGGYMVVDVRTDPTGRYAYVRRLHDEGTSHLTSTHSTDLIYRIAGGIEQLNEWYDSDSNFVGFDPAGNVAVMDRSVGGATAYHLQPFGEAWKESTSVFILGFDTEVGRYLLYDGEGITLVEIGSGPTASRTWHTAGFRPFDTFSCAAYDSSAPVAAVGGSNGHLQVWNFDSGESLYAGVRDHPITDMFFLDARHLFLAYSSRTDLIDLASGRTLHTAQYLSDVCRIGPGPGAGEAFAACLVPGKRHSVFKWGLA